MVSFEGCCVGFGGFDRLLPGLGWSFEGSWRVTGWFGVILSSLVIIVFTKQNIKVWGQGLLELGF